VKTPVPVTTNEARGHMVSNPSNTEAVQSAVPAPPEVVQSVSQMSPLLYVLIDQISDLIDRLPMGHTARNSLVAAGRGLLMVRSCLVRVV
jgi:hypothetical protein